MKTRGSSLLLATVVAALALGCPPPEPGPVEPPPEAKLATPYRKLVELERQKDQKAIREYAEQRNLRLSPITEARFRVDVEMKLTEGATEKVVASIKDSGGLIHTTYGHLVHAAVPIAFLSELAAMAEVRSIYQPDEDDLDATSEGLSDLGAAIWQAAGFDGTGVRVAILDSYFQGYADRQAAGDLPAAVTTSAYGYAAFADCAVGSDHGTECAEIVHDIVPGADLHLVCAYSETDFLNAVDDLIAVPVDIITHSRSTYSGPHDGSSRRSQKIDEARANGIVWTNSAGNRAQQHWAGDFNDDGGGTHIWDGADTRQAIQLTAGEGVKIRLVWNDWGVDVDGFPGGNATSQDYAVNLYRAGALVDSQDDNQVLNAATDPYEYLYYAAPATDTYEIEVVAVNNTGNPEFLELFVYSADVEHPVPEGSVPIYGDSAGSVTVGAVSVGDHDLQDYSGRGPTNGAGGGEADGTSRIKPDVVAPTSVTTWDGSFGGTSAAAPHVAGAAALVRQRTGLAAPDDIQAWLEMHADLLGYAGENNEVGNGLVRLCMLRNPSAEHDLDEWAAWGTPSFGGPADDQYFVLDTEGSHLRQDIDLSAFAAEIDTGAWEIHISGTLRADVIGVQEGYPYLYGYLIGTAGDANRINTYMTTGRVMSAVWTDTSVTYPIPAHTRSIRIFMMRSSYAGAVDANVAYFDDLCVWLNR